MTMNKETTDLDLLRKGARYTWGIIKEIHDIGQYSIVEYKPRPIGSGTPKEVGFGCYVDGKCLNTSSNTLEGALIICIAHGKDVRPDYANSMAHAASKLLDVKG